MQVEVSRLARSLYRALARAGNIRIEHLQRNLYRSTTLDLHIENLTLYHIFKAYRSLRNIYLAQVSVPQLYLWNFAILLRLSSFRDCQYTVLVYPHTHPWHAVRALVVDSSQSLYALCTAKYDIYCAVNHNARIGL